MNLRTLLLSAMANKRNESKDLLYHEAKNALDAVMARVAAGEPVNEKEIKSAKGLFLYEKSLKTARDYNRARIDFVARAKAAGVV